MGRAGAIGWVAPARRLALLLALAAGGLGLAAPVRAQAPPPVGGVPPAAEKAPLMAERFADNGARWPEGPGRYFAEDGYHLIGEDRETGTVFAAQPGSTPRAADVSVEAELRKVEGPDTRGYGIAIRSTTTPRRAYRLFVFGSGRFS